MKTTNDVGSPLPRKRERRHFVIFERDPAAAKARLELPVCMHEQEIMEVIHANDVVLISGATGTGKTTQVPQFLLEDGFGDPRAPVHKGIVAVTQPRRVAAVTCANRVAFELKSEVGDIVGYQIRHAAKLGAEVRAKFVTDGVLLREAENDILLQRYSAVVVDEVHERSLNTDLLLSFLSRTVTLRRENPGRLGPLKVIVMSATLDVEGVFRGDEALFPNPPVVKVPSRQYSVTMHFAKKTSEDYVEEAYKKVDKIHRRLPRGGILVFLTGRQEVIDLCSRLDKQFANRKVKIQGDTESEIGIKVLPFYALLSDRRQRAVFDDCGEDVRKVVVATNIAETSVTVPGISYVVDSGRAKEKVYKGEGAHALSAYEIRWVSKASADQRAGRAGRTGPGHCYRLYSSAVFDRQFEAFREPEVLRTPTDSVVLRLRAMGIKNVSKFPFPTRPCEKDLAASEKLLADLGALHEPGRIPSLDIGSGFSKGIEPNGTYLLGVTKLGKSLAKLPISPRFGKMLLSALSSKLPLSEGERQATARYTCRIAGVLTVGTVFDKTSESWREKHLVFQHRRSEILTELSAVCAVEHAGIQGGRRARYSVKSLDTQAMREVCKSYSLHFKSLTEALEIGYQLEKHLWGSERPAAASLLPPSKIVEECILRSVLTGLPDRIARRMTRDEGIAMGVIPRRRRKAFTVLGHGGAVYLEESSSIFLNGGVEFVSFSSLSEIALRRKRPRAEEDDEQRDDYNDSSSDDERAPGDDKPQPEEDNPATEQGVNSAEAVPTKVILRGASVISPAWLTTDATSMCHFDSQSSVACAASYDSDTDTVVEESSVRYGHWPLGVAKVPVGLLALCRQGSGTRCPTGSAAQYRALAAAVVTGRVRPGLRVDFAKEGTDRSGRVCVQRVADEMRRRACALSAHGLAKAVADADWLTAVVEACVGARFRVAVRKRYAEAVRRMVQEFSGGEGDGARKHEGEESGGEDDEEE